MANLPKASELIGSTVTEQQFKTKLKQLVENIDRSYTTLAEANADIAVTVLGENTTIRVTNDPTSANNGTYQWNGTTLTKSAYDPLTQAKADATAKANAAEQNATTHTDDIVFNGYLVDFYKTQTDTPAPSDNGAAGTVVYAEPLPNDGVITKAYGRLADSVTSFTVKIFEVDDANYVQVASSTVTVVVGAAEHALDTPLQIKKGQFIGFYTAGGASRHTFKTSKPVLYGTGDRTSLAVSGATTTFEYQMYFKIQVEPLLKDIEKNTKTSTENSTSIDLLNNMLLVDKQSLGAETLIGGDVKASVTYVPYVKPVDGTGLIDSVEFNLLAEDSVGFFVLRKISESIYTIVHETDYTAYPSGINTAILGNIPVLKGDLVGWKTLNKNIAFDTSVSAIDGGYYSTTKTSATTMQLNAAHTLAQPRVKFNLSFTQPSLQVVVLTQAQYDALPSKDPNVLYGVV